MASPLLTSHRLLFVLAVVLLINSQLPSSIAGLAGRVLQPVLDLAVLPVRAPLHSLAAGLRSSDDDAVDPPETAQTPEQLETAIRMARNRIDQLEQLADELKRKLYLVESVSEYGDTPTRPLSAKVNNYTDTGPSQIITINRGSNHGIEPGMTVVHDFALVGRVIAPVGPVSANVELVTSHDAVFQVRVQPRDSDVTYTNIRASPSGNGRTFIAQVGRDSPIRELADVRMADAVYYPDARGWLLGVVDSVGDYPADPTLYRQLVIRPEFDLRYGLEEVVVLLPSEESARPSRGDTGAGP